MSTRPAPLGLRFLQSVQSPTSKTYGNYYASPSSSALAAPADSRPPAGKVTPNYACPSPNRVRWNTSTNAAVNVHDYQTHSNDNSRAGTPTRRSGVSERRVGFAGGSTSTGNGASNTTPRRSRTDSITALITGSYATSAGGASDRNFNNGGSAFAEASPMRKAMRKGPSDNIQVGLTIVDSPSRGPSPCRKRSGSADGYASMYKNHLVGSGAQIETRFASTPRARGKMMCEAPTSFEDTRPHGLRQVSAARHPSPFLGVGILGPDPAEVERARRGENRPVPPPMVLKPWRRGVRHVPEPCSDISKPRYADDEPFRHSKRFISPSVREPTPTGLRTCVEERCREPQLIAFVGVNDNSRKQAFELRPQSIRCSSPHTPMRRTFNIISNKEC